MGLPEGVTLGMVAAVVIPVATITFMLRALPFSFLGLLRESSLVEFLGGMMPLGVMSVLVVYAIVSNAGSPGSIVSSLIASVVTLGIHAWRRSAALSILVGTATYMVLVNLVF